MLPNLNSRTSAATGHLVLLMLASACASQATTATESKSPRDATSLMDHLAGEIDAPGNTHLRKLGDLAEIDVERLGTEGLPQWALRWDDALPLSATVGYDFRYNEAVIALDEWAHAVAGAYHRHAMRLAETHRSTRSTVVEGEVLSMGADVADYVDARFAEEGEVPQDSRTAETAAWWQLISDKWRSLPAKVEVAATARSQLYVLRPALEEADSPQTATFLAKQDLQLAWTDIAAYLRLAEEIDGRLAGDLSAHAYALSRVKSLSYELAEAAQPTFYAALQSDINDALTYLAAGDWL